MSKEMYEWLSDYDFGKEVESVSMGGIGDGYEAAIQDCAIETMRLLPNDAPENKTEFAEILTKASDRAVKVLNGFHGFSGAQVGAANNMASVFWRQTPGKGLDMMRSSDPDRIIKIKKGKDNHPTIVRSFVDENKNK